MKPLHVSIAGMMGLVVFAGVGFAALRNASPVWAGAVTLSVFAIVGVAVLGAAYRRGAERAFWLGSALFGAIYLFLTSEIQLGRSATPVGKWLLDPNRPPLLTTLVLERLHPIIGPERGSGFIETPLDWFFVHPGDRAIAGPWSRRSRCGLPRRRRWKTCSRT
jgi:hypothetical protein